MSDTVTNLKTQVDDFFKLITKTAVEPLLDSDLPLVGEALATSLQTQLLAPVRSAVDNALNTLNNGNATAASEIATALNGKAGGAITATAAGTVVTIDIVAQDQVHLDTDPFDVDAGFDALNLKLKGALDANLGYGVDTRITFDTSSGVLSLVDDPDQAAVTLHLDASLKQLFAGAELGFFDLTAIDQYDESELLFDATADIASGTVTSRTLSDLTMRLNGSANIDLAIKAGITTSDDPTTQSVLPTVYADLVGTYTLTDYDPLGNDALPDPYLALEEIELDVGSTLTFLGKTFQPIVDDVFGSFPIKQLLNTLTAPLPVISAAVFDVGAPLTELDVIDDDRINLLDLAVIGGSVGGASKESIENFSKAFSLINALSELGDGNAFEGRIALGSQVLVGSPPPAPLSLAPLSLEGADGGSPSDQLADELGGINPSNAGTGLAGAAASLAAILDDAGFSIPLLDDPTAVVKLLLTGPDSGNPVDLIEYKVPELKFEAGFAKFFPVIGPLGVKFEGLFHAKLDFSVGYDTGGLSADGFNFADGFYFTTELNLDEDGNPKPTTVDDETTFFKPAGEVGAQITASAAVNVGLAEAGVGGGIFADLFAYFDGAANPDDGKLRLTDFGSCIFDPITGEFGLKVQAYFTVGFSPFDYTKRFDLIRAVLAEFSYGCPPPESDPGRGLATLIANTTLRLNAGDFDDFRVINGRVIEDPKREESYVISNAANGALLVSAFGINEINGHPNAGEKTDDKVSVTKVVARMGALNDQVAFQPDVATPAYLLGGGGDDLLASGLGNDTLFGEDGADRLIGLDGDDYLYGGTGSDTLEGGEGADVIDGGVGAVDDVDQASYETSAAGVIFTPGAAKGSFNGTGGDAQGDVLKSIEHLIGSHYDDGLTGTPAGANILEGLSGADVLTGGFKEDLLLGGSDGDTIDGGVGNDTISFLSSNGRVTVTLADGKSKGHGSDGDAEGDTYVSVENVQGSFGDDLLIGNSGVNTLDGWFGDDIILGGKGKDVLRGGAGDDTVYGGSDGDFLDGGGTLNNSGRDLLSYSGLSYGVTVSLYDKEPVSPQQDRIARAVLPGFLVDVEQEHASTFEDLTGSNYKDTLTGDIQANVIKGLDGNDTLDGSDANDRLVGGRGADILRGGDGRDLADYSASLAGVAVSLQQNLGKFGDAQGDKFDDVEDLLGSRNADTLTGDAQSNRIDPGLSGVGNARDKVNGWSDPFLGGDVLAVNYGLGDVGKGVFGGFSTADQNGIPSGGFFERRVVGSTARLDGVDFVNIERLSVIGTSKGDVLNGGAFADQFFSGDGADIVYGGLGFDLIDAGGGNDSVAIGTTLDGFLSLAADERFGFADGGRGIDLLSLSLAQVTDDVVLTGTDGKADFTGINYATAQGAAVNFEVLFAILTGFGDDRLTQGGGFATAFGTGWGTDVLTPGLGRDAVDGGLDFHLGENVDFGDEQGLLVTTANDFADVFAESGDQLVLNYLGAGAGILSQVGQVTTGYTVARPQDQGDGIEVFSNSGYYAAGNDRVDFANIERVEIIGSQFGDGIFGTDLTYGINAYVGPDQALVASASVRGDDRIFGYTGDDILIGGTGDDVLNGGDGDDVLVGTKSSGRQLRAAVDLGEVDLLTGGKGRDIFVAGADQPYYNDQANPEDSVGFHRRSTANRMVATDFDAKFDTLILSANNAGSGAPAPQYRAVEQGGSTFIYLRDGRDFSNNANPANDELIAKLQGTTGFTLTGKYVLYYNSNGTYSYGDGTTAPTPGGGKPGGDALAALHADEAAEAAARPAETSDAAAMVRGIDAAAKPIAADRETAAGPAAAAAAPWVAQTANTAVLQKALFNSTPVFNGGTLTIEGNSAAFGIFKADPFGLGSGVVISTGRVADLAGPNLIDGGQQQPTSSSLVFTNVGRVNEGIVPPPPDNNKTGSTIYRVNLSDLGYDLNSLVLGDSASGFGGGGGIASGFDIDAIVLSREYVDQFDTLEQFENLTREPGLTFDLARVQYSPGDLRKPAGDEEYPAGAENGLPDLFRATLDTIDGTTSLAQGSLTLGDGGSLGIDLTQTAKSGGPLYLYVAETGNAGETITTGLTASSGRLTAPADLSTDLGMRGADDDTTALVYSFVLRTDDQGLNTVSFDIVFFSEEFAEFAQAGFNDTFKVILNGTNIAELSSGAFATVDTLYAPPAGPDATSSIWSLVTDPGESDLILNPVGTGPAAGTTRADGFSRVLHLTGTILPGQQNELRIEVSDKGDALLDSGILISGGSFRGDDRATFTIDGGAAVLHEGERRQVTFGLEVARGAQVTERATVVFTPSATVDLGAGPGRQVRRVLDPDHITGQLTAFVADDGQDGRDRTETIKVEVIGLPGTTEVAPLTFRVTDDPVSRTYTVGDASERDSSGWAGAWSHEGLRITHTANLASGGYSAVSFNDQRATTLVGGDIIAGDLGVSGSSGASTPAPQDIGGTEALRFDFASRAVTSLSIDLGRLEAGDVAKLQLLDADGRVIATEFYRQPTLTLTRLSGVAALVVSADQGALVVDSLTVTEDVPFDPTGGARLSTPTYSELLSGSPAIVDHDGSRLGNAFIRDNLISWVEPGEMYRAEANWHSDSREFSGLSVDCLLV